MSDVASSDASSWVTKGRFRGRSVVIVVLVVILLVAGFLWLRHKSPPPLTVPISNQYTVVGNKIIGPTGKQFIPEGIVVLGLSLPDWQAYVSSDENDIAAIADFWHANAVRLQIAPTNLLFGHNTSSFLAAVKKEVSYALSLGLDVWISAQYEHVSSLGMPNQSTQRFWKDIAPIYRSNTRVWFDLFNEPRLGGRNKSAASAWNTWQNGSGKYVGMQALVDTIRATGAKNIILAEGMMYAHTLDEVPSHMLHGGNIVYEVHAYFIQPGFSTPASWASNWGDLSSKLAVVVGEWSEYQSQKTSCVRDPRTLVPEFLDYLSSHDIGLIAWALLPGVLIRGTNVRDPTTFSSTAPYLCTASRQPDGQGAGASVLAYFATHSHPAPAIAG
jgi:hypothetical protein